MHVIGGYQKFHVNEKKPTNEANMNMSPPKHEAKKKIIKNKKKLT